MKLKEQKSHWCKRWILLCPLSCVSAVRMQRCFHTSIPVLHTELDPNPLLGPYYFHWTQCFSSLRRFLIPLSLSVHWDEKKFTQLAIPHWLILLVSLEETDCLMKTFCTCWDLDSCVSNFRKHGCNVIVISFWGFALVCFHAHAESLG